MEYATITIVSLIIILQVEIHLTVLCELNMFSKVYCSTFFPFFLPALAESLACVQSHQWGGSRHPLQLQVVKRNLTDQKILKGGPHGRVTLRQKSQFGPKVVSKLSQSCPKVVTKLFLSCLMQCLIKNFPNVSQSCSSEDIWEIRGMVGPQV